MLPHPSPILTLNASPCHPCHPNPRLLLTITEPEGIRSRTSTPRSGNRGPHLGPASRIELNWTELNSHNGFTLWRACQNQRCVLGGIALSSLLSCRLLAYLNSHGSPVAPTWAHLCWPGSRSVHGSIHSCVIRRPHFVWPGNLKYCLLPLPHCAD